VEKLRQKYAGNPGLDSVAIDNTYGKGNARVVNFDALPHLVEDGLEERLEDALKRELEAGRISQDVFDRTNARRVVQK